ncbi:MAG: M14 family zinc carboxypeptidase [Candidatus Promineifilaceae bacterium]|nr:M14 family zinc carboxypeptidase [Candidatus Promineifilaceae bacterium]
MRQIVCPNCKEPQPAEASFCAHCGHPLSPTGGNGQEALVLIVTGFLLFIAAVGGAFLLTIFLMGRLSSTGPEEPGGGEPAAAVVITRAPVGDGITVTPSSTPSATPPVTTTERPSPTPSITPAPSSTPSPTASAVPPSQPEKLILGYSVEDQPIEAARFGDGPRAVVFVGGLHAGFAPSSVRLAEQTVDYFRKTPEAVPVGVTLYVILSMNPDSVYDPGALPGRLNANGVDLNRNWDCDWTPNPEIEGRTIPGAGGPQPFSEPETQAVAEFLLFVEPAAVVFWEARASGGLVSPGGCGQLSAASQSLAEQYARAARYQRERFESYAGQTVPGDASNWADGQGFPSIVVLLPSATAVDWEANRAAIEAVLRASGE